MEVHYYYSCFGGEREERKRKKEKEKVKWDVGQPLSLSLVKL